MQKLFPPEIIEFSAEKHYSNFRVRSRVIYLTVLLFVTACIVSLPFIRVDVSTQSRGVIRTSSENTVVQSAIYGEVVYYNLSENKFISKGDVLVQFDSSHLDEQVRFYTEKHEQNNLFISDLSTILREGAPHTSRYKAVYKQHSSRKKDQEIQLNFLKKELQTAQILWDRNIISSFEYLSSKNDFEKAESVLANIKEDFFAACQIEQTNLELENKNLLSNIAQLEKNKKNYTIIAPVSGSLIQVSGFQTGNFIGPNQAIAYIAVSDSLLGECYISPMHIGYVKEKQRVVFQIDAFDYHEWGFIEGFVDEILTDIIYMSEKPMFRVRCRLNSNCLQLKNGYEGCIQKGMSFTGRFQLTRRSLWQLLFDKVDNWMNPNIKSYE